MIDAWIQHPTPRFVADPMFASLRRWMKLEVVPQEFPPELTLAALDAAGVQLALVSAWYGPQGALLSNDEVAGLVRAHPTRFAGVASVDLRHPMDAVRELRRAVRELGFKGLRMLPWLWELPPDDRRYYPLYAECVELGIPFCTQIGHAGPLKPSEPGRPIPYLDHVACEFPELVIVAGHVGYPWTDEAVSLATKYENVYLDSSAYKASRLPEPFVRFLKGHGRKKVMFGSNFPMITPAACLEGLDQLGLDDLARRLFLHENAARVFRL
jgi:predicted TIM-barrel fold metal-dependent hydrolase